MSEREPSPIERAAEAIWRTGRWPPIHDDLRFNQLADELQQKYLDCACAAIAAYQFCISEEFHKQLVDQIVADFSLEVEVEKDIQRGACRSDHRFKL